MRWFKRLISRLTRGRLFEHYDHTRLLLWTVSEGKDHTTHVHVYIDPDLDDKLRQTATDLAAQFNLSPEDTVRRLRETLTEVFEGRKS